ncbi:hypothetical protein AB6A40_006063 [Gnathostoma spinigerum]|uniref:Uncharacterized protein n=1 Tax=Gnathostoma spinigerum TaxID=75299 RepID=A0ABD6EPY1_9BILA
MARCRGNSIEYDLNAGRNAFRCNNDDLNAVWDLVGNVEVEDRLIRQHKAMRSFTESVDSDLPPAPELPHSLDIDYQYPNQTMKSSDTSDTIIEVKKPENEDVTESKEDEKKDGSLGATQKYPLIVSGPGRVDAECELHESLLDTEEASDSDNELQEFAKQTQKKSALKRPKTISDDFESLRQEYAVRAVERPRPVTPTSWCAIENYVEGSSTTADTEKSHPTDSGNQMKVKIPGTDDSPRRGYHRRRSSMSWSEFYEVMATQLPNKGRSSSVQSGRSTPLNDYEGDILEEDPEYSKRAPRKPVIHRLASTEWENFEETGVFNKNMLIFL